MIAYVVFPVDNDDDDEDNDITIVPFYFDLFNSRVNEELMIMSRFLMMHHIPNLWDYNYEMIDVDVDKYPRM
jgi:hypothetical protein